MKTKMQDTSLQAYNEIKPDLQPKEAAVMRAFHFRSIPLTQLEVSAYLSWPINCVTGRINSLVAKRELKYAGQKKQNGRSVNMYQL